MTPLFINQVFSNKIKIHDKNFDFFSGTSYLGLNTDTTFQSLLTEGFKKYGTSFGSSRNGNFQLEIYEQAEAFLANKIGAESAITVSSGMLAGQLLVNHFYTQSPHYIYAPQTHAANFHKPDIATPKISFSEWAATINQQIEQQNNSNIIIVCNSCDALKVSQYDFSWTKNLPTEKNLTLIIDDSHGIGVISEDGSGIFKQIQVSENVELIIIASLHKGFGIPGGVILGQKRRINELKYHNAFFTSCSPITPAYLYALCHAGDLYKQQLERLRLNIKTFISQIQKIDFLSYQDDYPVFYTPKSELYEYLFQHEIFIYHFAYPIQAGIPNTRIVLNASHDIEQIQKLADKLNNFSII